MLVVLLLHLAAAFNPDRIEYCKIRCAHNLQFSSGCYCTKAPNRHEITDDMVEFRRTVLRLHNQIRNTVAMGDEENRGYPPASDMQVLNYDLELEYLARCYLTSTRFVDAPDPCTATSYCTPYPPSQNLFGAATRDTSLEWVQRAVVAWFKESENIPKEKRRGLVERYEQDEWNSTHFTQMIWSSMRKIGCVRAWLPDNKEEWRFVLACNYAGLKHICTANLVDTPVYEAGKPCGKCKRRCNYKRKGVYQALCGYSWRVPKMTPSEIGRGSESAGQEQKGVMHRNVEKYLEEEYADEVVEVFFDNRSNSLDSDRVLLALALLLVYN